VSKSNQARTATAALVIAGVTKISVTRAVYFLGDSPKITAKTGDVLRALRDLLKNKKNITVTVTGWVKETAKKDHDLKLSADRAANIVFVLRQLFHVNAVYNYVGKGISPENTDKSRRADILVTYTN
jgi:outer membrane protein OmpA-like peptidoglycan-associated protein